MTLAYFTHSCQFASSAGQPFSFCTSPRDAHPFAGRARSYREAGDARFPGGAGPARAVSADGIAIAMAKMSIAVGRSWAIVANAYASPLGARASRRLGQQPRWPAELHSVTVTSMRLPGPPPRLGSNPRCQLDVVQRGSYNRASLNAHNNPDTRCYTLDTVNIHGPESCAYSLSAC